MKSLLKVVFFAVVLPVLAMVALGAVVNRISPAPTPVPTVVDSGERWYNPFSWQNDELAAIAHQQAEAAQANSVGFTGTTMLMIMGAVGVGLAVVYGREDVSKAYHVHKDIKRSSKEIPDQLPPPGISKGSENETAESVVTAAQTRKHPGAVPAGA